MTISLSNDLFRPMTKKKVISIKKASEIFEKQKDQNETSNGQRISLQIKIDQLKNEIEKLEEEKTKLLSKFERTNRKKTKMARTKEMN